MRVIIIIIIIIINIIIISVVIVIIVIYSFTGKNAHQNDGISPSSSSLNGGGGVTARKNLLHHATWSCATTAASLHDVKPKGPFFLWGSAPCLPRSTTSSLSLHSPLMPSWDVVWHPFLGCGK